MRCSKHWGLCLLSLGLGIFLGTVLSSRLLGFLLALAAMGLGLCVTHRA